MNSDELYTLKSMVLDNYEQYHDGLRILLESDKGLYKAFGQSPRTKYLKTENFYLTSKERLTYILFTKKPSTYQEFYQMCRDYGMTMASVRFEEAWAMAKWLEREGKYTISPNSKF